MLEGGSTARIGAVVDKIAQYRKYADECQSWAATTKNPEHKKQLLEMAAAWDAVAGQQMSEPKLLSEAALPRNPSNRGVPAK
jgi:hypothetical protein